MKMAFWDYANYTSSLESSVTMMSFINCWISALNAKVSTDIVFNKLSQSMLKPDPPGA